MSWKNTIRKEKEPEFGKPLKEPIVQFCDNCGGKVTMPKGAIYGQDNSKFCKICGKGTIRKDEDNEPFICPECGREGTKAKNSQVCTRCEDEYQTGFNPPMNVPWPSNAPRY